MGGSADARTTAGEGASAPRGGGEGGDAGAGVVCGRGGQVEGAEGPSSGSPIVPSYQEGGEARTGPSSQSPIVTSYQEGEARMDGELKWRWTCIWIFCGRGEGGLAGEIRPAAAEQWSRWERAASRSASSL